MKKLSLRLIFFMALLGVCSNLGAQNIYTFAGVSGAVGYTGDGGFATLSNMSGPRGMATGPTGNVYFCDQMNNVVRMINTSGVISTVAGRGTVGFGGDGGPATAAQLSNPIGVAVDASGNVYIADANNNRIRKVNTSGIISSIAGNGTPGYGGDGGSATAALLNRPFGVLVSPAGNVYIAESRNYDVRMVNTSGIISRVAGDTISGYSGDGGAATAAMLARPFGLAMDASGNLYISDYNSNVIRKVNTSGVISTFAGTGAPGFSGDGGAATAAMLNAPTGITMDGSGNLYIADFNNNRIRKITSAGTISTYTGNGTRGYYGDGGPAVSAELNNPFGIAIFGANNFYVADYGNDVIRRVGTPVRSITITSNMGDTVCAGGAVHFSAAFYADTFAHFQWQVNGANVGADSAGYIYTPATGDMVDCILKDSTGTHLAISETLTVDSMPVSGFILGPPSLCVGSVAFLRDSVPGGGGFGGRWLDKDTTVASLGRPSIVTGLSLGADTIYYINSNVCGSDSARIIIDVITNPFGPISGPATICAFDTATFHDATPGGNWNVPGGGGAGASTIDNLTGLFTAGRRPGHVVIAYGNPGCQVIDSVTVLAAPRVSRIFSVTGAVSVYDGLTLALADTTAGGVWSSNDTAIAKVDPSGTVTGVSGGIAVISYAVTNIAGCTAFRVDTIYVLGTNGVNNLQNNTAFSIFPNPASGSVYVSWVGQNSGTGAIVISDVTGREICKASLSFSKSNGQLPIDISTLKTGIYMISIKSENGSYYSKLVVQ